MSEDAGKNVMLYFFEVLMKSSKPLPLCHLVSHFSKKRFSNDMRVAVGGSELGLRALLSKFPSIFTLSGNMVGLSDWPLEEPNTPLSRESSDSDLVSSSKTNTFTPNVSAEMDAVRFFQDKFIKRSSREMPIKSLAGHLSQASLSIRRVVGPQLHFKTWLLKHPHIFEVEKDLVKLQDDVAALILDVEMAENDIIYSQNSSGTVKSKSEIMAIVFLGDLIKQHPGLKVEQVDDFISLAPTSVQNFINSKNIEQFVNENLCYFLIKDGVITEVKSPCSNLVRVSDLDKVEISEEEAQVGAIVGKGRIYHIAKLWGIIDLGQHDHVFFDRSILPKATLDMKKEYKVGQVLCFKALPAPKTSRAKWKALAVWKPSVAGGDEEDGVENKGKGDEVWKLEEELYRLVLADHQRVDELLSSDEENTCNVEKGIREETYKEKITNGILEKKLPSSKLLKQESDPTYPQTFLKHTNDFLKHTKYSNITTTTSNGSKVRFEMPLNPCQSFSSFPSSRLVSVACQTNSTGDIIATQLYTH